MGHKINNKNIWDILDSIGLFTKGNGTANDKVRYPENINFVLTSEKTGKKTIIEHKSN